MKLVGYYKEKSLQILIDTGSTLSFIKEDTATTLNPVMKEIPTLMVVVANAQKLLTSKVTTSFCWKIQEYDFWHPLGLLHKEGFDLILGCDWVEAHSPIKIEYEKMLVIVSVNGKKVRLHAQNNKVHCQMINSHTLHKICSHGDETGVEEIYIISQSKADMVDNPKLDHLLEISEDIFKSKSSFYHIRKLGIKLSSS